MADTQSTPSSQRTSIKPEPYAPPAKSSQPDPDKADPPTATKAGRGAATKADQSGPKLTAVTITIDPDSAEVVRVEGLDAAGARHELSDEEKASLMKEKPRDERIAEVVERAFEAGIASVLGDEEEETTEETPADAELRHLLLAPLIERSAVRRLTERATLNRAILGTLIEHSMK
jgi:hypothetical protein